MAGRLAPDGVGLRHEEGRSAADDGKAAAARRQEIGVVPEPRGHPLPVIGLARHLHGQMALAFLGHGSSIVSRLRSGSIGRRI